MRLSSLHIRGFGRFEDASIDLDSPVIALVGPNEAGKTTLLRALMELEDSEAVLPADETRDAKTPKRPKDEVLVARYLLGPDDVKAAAGMGGVGTPRWLVLTKQRDGSRIVTTEPPVTRDRSGREKLLEVLAKAGRNTRMKRFLAQRVVGVEDSDELRSLRAEFSALANDLRSDSETLPDQVVTRISKLRGVLGAVEDLRGAQPSVVSAISRAVAEAEEVEAADPPSSAVPVLLDSRRPSARLFSDGDRRLNHEYDSTSLQGPPAALSNLLNMAGVAGKEVSAAITNEFHHERLGLQLKANEQLRNRFQAAWNQSGIYPVLHFEADTVRIHVPSRTTLAPIAERSDGLRMFVALVAFTDRFRTGPPPILLVDEAERHLHYDAQADLVRVFENQELVPQIIYTTHSAGCLPSDLGVGVRAVQPEEDSKLSDSARSTITSSFWSEGAGFSPLLFAMGANVLAFAPARVAVLTEGRSDPILLPSLLREAGARSSLPFQVAPGIASIAKSAVADLDLEAPRVGFLLDGDSGGRANAKKLISGGMPKSLVLTLPNGRVLEDYIAPDVYLLAVNEELRRSHGDGYSIQTTLPAKERPAAIKAVCASMGVSEPNKVRVASRVLEARKASNLIDPKRKKELAGVLKKLETALGFE